MKAIVKLINLAEALTASGEIGDGMVAQFHALASEAATELNNRSDHEIAIGEHAFKSGFKEAALFAEPRRDMGMSEHAIAACSHAWEAYTPPDELTGGGKAEAPDVLKAGCDECGGFVQHGKGCSQNPNFREPIFRVGSRFDRNTFNN